ncbi:MAG: hypothetical protein A2Z52_00595 [Candidatus Moranbacteria bacterium RBG_19FT_COMBO_42_6]|nr:MAG: hypothetical protein A2Z52_00595 [Candidatus Moranbacteria bacterium RBG_19FT_COMBO_42_6]
MDKYLKPDSRHVCEKYRLTLHSALSDCNREIAVVTIQATTVLKAGRREELTKLNINGRPAQLEDILLASEFISKFFKTHHITQNLFEKSEGEIKKAIDELEKHLERIQKRLRGIKIPKRPPEVDEWMKK